MQQIQNEPENDGLPGLYMTVSSSNITKVDSERPNMV